MVAMPTHDKFAVGLIQMAMTTDPDTNLAQAAQLVEQAVREGAQVVCLPELFRSPYFCQREDPTLFDLAESIPGPSTERLGQIAKSRRVTVIASLFERRAAGLYHNTVAVLDAQGQIAGLYRKMHIPDDPGFYEKFYFTPGDLGFKAFETPVGRIGVLICWDQWYPEAARLTALQGAEILFYPTAIGWLPEEKEACGAAQQDAWRTVQRGHAIANGCYVAAVNRIGLEKPAEDESGIEFWGSTFLSDPLGVMVAEADTATETVLIAEVDRARIEDTRRIWPFLRDRRIDAYGRIDERFIDNE